MPSMVALMIVTGAGNARKPSAMLHSPGYIGSVIQTMLPLAA